MSRYRAVRKGLGLAAIVAALALVAVDPASAGGRHRHHDDGFVSFGFSFPAYGYDDYGYDPYYAPAYAYRPPYEPYGPYDDEPMYYNDGASQYSSPYRSDEGSYCREFQTTVVIDGRPERAFGTACMQPDGSWAVVN
jgi:hypothetical protein